MYITLALVVLLGAIFVLFSQDFIKVIKKILGIKGAKLILPIALASWCIYTFNYYVLWGLYYCHEALQSITAFFAKFIPFKSIATPIVTILFLTFISVAPVFLLDWYLWKKSYKHYQYPYLTSTLIWIVCSALLIARI